MDSNRLGEPSGLGQPPGSPGVNADALDLGEHGEKFHAGEGGIHQADMVGGLELRSGQPLQKRANGSRRFKRLALVSILTAAVVAALSASGGLLSAAREGRLEPAEQPAGLPAAEQPPEHLEPGTTPPTVEPSPQPAGVPAEPTIPTGRPAVPPVGERGSAQLGEGGDKPQAGEDYEGRGAAAGTKLEAGQRAGEDGKGIPLGKDKGLSEKVGVGETKGLPEKEDFGKKAPVSLPVEVQPRVRQRPVLNLVDTLTEAKFDAVYKVDKNDLSSIAHHLKGPRHQAVVADGSYLLREHLDDFEPGRMLDIMVLHVYSQRIAKKNLVVSPLQVSTAFAEFLRSKKEPHLPQEIIDKAKDAKRVIFALAVPLYIRETKQYTAAPRHFLLCVIDRERKVLSVVDSLPQAREYYNPILDFLRLAAAQLDVQVSSRAYETFHREIDVSSVSSISGDPATPYRNAPSTPEPGFPTQAEFRPNLQQIPQQYFNACGPFVLENMLCIAENRPTNYALDDVVSLRYRMLLEIFNGLWDRPRLDGYMRDAED